MPPQAPAPQQFRKNDVLFKEGADAKHFYILMTGKLAIFRHGHFVRSIGGRGTFVGEMGVLLNFRRSATVIILEDATLIVISKRVEEIFTHHLEIGAKLIESLRHRMSESYDRAEKMWAQILKELAEMIVYEASTKAAARKSLSFDKMESEKTAMRQLVERKFQSEDFEFPKIADFLKQLDIEAEYARHVREKYPGFKYLDLGTIKNLWKKRVPEPLAEMYQHCIQLAAGLNQVTDFITSFQLQDDTTSAEEIAMLESAIQLPRRIAILRGASQRILTPKEGIEKMKKINRDIDGEVEEAGRQEQRTGRTFHLSEFADKLGIGKDYIADLRKEYWETLQKI